MKNNNMQYSLMHTPSHVHCWGTICVPIFMFEQNNKTYMAYPFINSNGYPFSCSYNDLYNIDGNYIYSSYPEVSDIYEELKLKVYTKNPANDVTSEFMKLYPNYRNLWSEVICVNVTDNVIDYSGYARSFDKLDLMSYDNIETYATFNCNHCYVFENLNHINKTVFQSVVSHDITGAISIMPLEINMTDRMNDIVSTFDLIGKKYRIRKDINVSVGTLTNIKNWILSVPVSGNSYIDASDISSIILPVSGTFECENISFKYDLIRNDIEEVPNDTKDSYYKFSKHGYAKDILGNDLSENDPVIINYKNKSHFGVVTSVNNHEVKVIPKDGKLELKRYTGEVVKCTGNLNALFMERK